MEDLRKFNGGNSTKALGLDKRKNEFKYILNTSLLPKDIVDVLKMLHTKAIQEKDVNAGKIILEYFLGKPTQTIEQTTELTVNNFDIAKIYEET